LADGLRKLARLSWDGNKHVGCGVVHLYRGCLPEAQQKISMLECSVPPSRWG
jgi:hypothetical protein